MKGRHILNPVGPDINILVDYVEISSRCHSPKNAICLHDYKHRYVLNNCVPLSTNANTIA